ncbi:hypothetical protein IAT40_006087 [Kwoniella sp. CBS 6097]
MAQVSITSEQSAQLQAGIQQELERREWAEPDDNVMAEYITVLLANGSTRERVHTEMDDLVGSDFDPAFLDWLFDQASNIASAPAPAPEPVALAPPAVSPTVSAPRQPPSAGGSRMLNTALAPLSSQPEKRKAETQEGSNKKRLSDVGAAPSGPRALGEGRGLADRIGGPGPAAGVVRPGFGGGQNVRGRGVPIRGLAGGRGGMGQGRGMNHMGGFRHNFQQQQQQQQNLGMMQPGFAQPFMAPGQQEMMAQMMMMQASMAQMGEMMAQMAEERQQQSQQPIPSPVPTPTAVRPARPPAPAKLPHGTKLGGHSVSAIPPKSSTPGPIPDKPSSTALCRYSVGCSNSRCPFSHPSPVADERTGMVLSEEPCENGKSCKDAECVKSHVSPAAALGDNAGPSRLLCKYQNCTNPSCPFRHEDAAGNPIPPPALTAAKAAKEARAAPAPSSDNEDGEFEVVMSHKGLMDGALDDTKKDVACRYAERCTRPDCKFSHPASRPVPKAKKPLTGYNKSITSTNGGGIGGGMHMSKKFATAPATATTTTTTKSLNLGAGEFKPSAPAVAPAAPEKDLEVTI